MIAAGINSKALSTYMGHSSITITLDRYGHSITGSEPTRTRQQARPTIAMRPDGAGRVSYHARARPGARLKGAAGGFLADGPV
jgi:hypothetical protein